MSAFDLTLKLFLQLTVILAVCRVVGLLGRHIGQTQVVSEMIAGVMLGPSLFGLLAPAAQEWLFPQRALIEVAGATATIAHPSMAILYAISQVGLVLYMFLVGLEFNSDLILGRLRSAGMVSGAGIVVPFTLGALAAVTLAGKVDLFCPGISPAMAALYLGASMSITAFPMLARIIFEKGIAGTRMGTLALAAGSMDDAIAWCLLAIVLASVKGSASIAVLAIGGGTLFALGMVFVGKRVFGRFTLWTERDDGVSRGTLLTMLLVLMMAAWFTDFIGIYAVFGAFLTGVAMPRGRFAKEVRGHLEFLTTTFLLPIFFVYSGLNTRIGLLDSAALWGFTALILLLAVAGKGVACTLAARVSGEPWRESITIGTLMNARGLMELIILNIGLQEGILTPILFTIMVMMAVLTTLKASPLFEWIYGRHLALAKAETEAVPKAAVAVQ